MDVRVYLAKTEAQANGIPEQAGRVWGVEVGSVTRVGKVVRVDGPDGMGAQLDAVFPGSKGEALPWQCVTRINGLPADDPNVTAIDLARWT